MNNTLYPIKFAPILKDKIWGGSRLKNILNKKNAGKKCGESWEISSVEDNVSVISNGFLSHNEFDEIIEIYMGDILGDKVYKTFGTQFPLLIKFIDANDILSVQVHPDDKLANKRHNSYGKTELWYIIEAEKNSKIISGFSKQTTKEEYTNGVKENKVESLLKNHDVNKNDVFYIPSGRIHAIGKGILLAEIQQTSDITYRIYDWNRKDDSGNYRELHNELAINAIDFKQYDNYKIKYAPATNKATEIITTPYFKTNIINCDKLINRDYFSIDSFVIYMCLEGEADIIYTENNDKENIKTGESILIPAVLKNINIKPQPKVKILEIYIGNFQE